METALDTEWSHAIAPNAKILVVEAASDSGTNLLKAVDYARGKSDVVAVSMSWGGAAGTWFWIDPTNDLLFVGMIQRMGGTGGDDLGTQARTLTYQALLHPEK